jgi:hypothetical protein
MDKIGEPDNTAEKKAGRLVREERSSEGLNHQIIVCRKVF